MPKKKWRMKVIDFARARQTQKKGLFFFALLTFIVWNSSFSITVGVNSISGSEKWALVTSEII